MRVPGTWWTPFVALTLVRPVLAQGPETPSEDSGADAEQTTGHPGDTPDIPLIPPRPLSTPVSYPKGGKGTQTVKLELVVSSSGTVSSLKVLSGTEPFSTAAREASEQWVFVPARRGPDTVPARIRFQVTFREQLVPPPRAQEAGETTDGAALATVVDAPVEIVVEGEIPPGAERITSTDARLIPGSFGDPIRAIEALGGVSVVVSGLPIFYVRGAPPGNVGFFIDGLRVPYLFHDFFLHSTIHPMMVDSVDVHKGPYPARLGRYAGAAVELNTSEPQENLRAVGGLSLFDANAFASSTFDDGQGRAAVSGRYSLSQLILSELIPAEFSYWDYQARVAYDVTEKDTLGVFGFGAYDFFQPDEGEDLDESTSPTGVEFHRVDLRYDRRFSRSTKSRVAATIGIDRTQLPNGYTQDLSFGGRAEIESNLDEHTSLRAGLQGNSDDYELRLAANTPSYDDFIRLFPTRTDYVAGGYVDVTFKPVPRIEVVPGIRADVYGSLGQIEVGVDPRVRSRFRLSQLVSTTHSVGLSHQTPNFVPGIPGAQVAGFPNGLQRAVHTDHGVLLEFSDELSAGGNFFLNSYFNLSDPIGLQQDFVPNADLAELPLQGSSIGMELSLRRKLTKQFGGILSYTLSRSTRSYGDVKMQSGYDRTHVLSGGLAYKLWEHLQLSARAIVYSGIIGAHVDQSADAGPIRRIYDQGRGEPFFRLDARIEYRRKLFHAGYWMVFAEMLNTTLTKETIRRTCNANGCTEDVVGPLALPNVGLELAY